MKRALTRLAQRANPGRLAGAESHLGAVNGIAGLGFVLATFLTGCSLTGCSDSAPLALASEASVGASVQARMGEVKHCWSAGDKKKSWLAGEVQTLHVDVLATGKVKATFNKPENNKHPVGSCMRSALDGLRFQPAEQGLLVKLPVRLGRPSQGTAAAP